MTSYQSVVVSIAASCTIFEIFGVEKYRDFEIKYRVCEVSDFCTLPCHCYYCKIVLVISVY